MMRAAGGLCLVRCLFFFCWFYCCCCWLFFFFSPAATAVAICFCNCSLKASGKKAVLIVQITEQLNHRNSPKESVQPFDCTINLAGGISPIPVRPASDDGHKAVAKWDVGTVVCHKCQFCSGQSEVRPPSAICDWQCANAGCQAAPHLVKMGSQMQPGIMKADISRNWSVLGSNYSLLLQTDLPKRISD